MKPLQEAIVKVREAERQLSGVRELLGKVAFPDSEELAQQHLTQVKTPPSATPVGEICRCDERDIWVAIFSNYDQLTTEYCPKCGKLLLT